MADYLIEQGEDLWFDHLAGHPNYDGHCPYCEPDPPEPKKRTRSK